MPQKNALIERVVKANLAKAKKEEFEGEVPEALSADHLRQLSELAGMKLTPLLRDFLATPGAYSWFGFSLSHAKGRYQLPADLFSDGPADVLKRQKKWMAAKAEYDFDHPPLVLLTQQEDPLACLEDGSIVRVCSNDGSIDDEEPFGVSTFKDFLELYAKQLEKDVRS